MRTFVACLILAVLAWCQCTTPAFNPMTGDFNCSSAGVKQTANYFYAGPASGVPAPAAFRALVSADVPDNAANTSGLAANLSGNQTANYLYAGPASGAAAPAGFRLMVAADLPAWVCVPTTYTLAYNDSIFTAAASTVTKTLLTLTGTSQVLCDPAETTTVLYAGTGITAMTCSVGTATVGNSAVYVPAINVFAASPSYTASASMRPGDLAVPDSSLAVVVSCTANVNFGSGTTTVLTAGTIKLTLGVKTLP